MSDQCDHLADEVSTCENVYRPIGFTSIRKFISSIFQSGREFRVESKGYGSSVVSQAEADEQALSRATDRTNELLQLKLDVMGYVTRLRYNVKLGFQSSVGYVRSFSKVAPYGTKTQINPWMGAEKKKAADYRVTAMIPHLDTIEALAMCIESLRAQTERPFICVVDTGSPPEVCEMLEEMRLMSDDLEIHYIRAQSYSHSSEPVTAAMDLAQSLCRTEFMFHTHADCFLRRWDFLENIIRICGPENPVVGYRMSTRHWATDEWSSMVGHTATMLYMPTIHKIGAIWSMQTAHHRFGYGLISVKGGGWPDTEIAFNRIIQENGIKPIFIGHDTNYERFVDSNLDHPRSYAGSVIYDKEYHTEATRWMKAALSEGQERLSVHAASSSSPQSSEP